MFSSKASKASINTQQKTNPHMGNMGGSSARTASLDVPSIIAADMTIKGDIKSDGEVQIDGIVDGDVTARDILIGAHGRITGEIRADTVRVCGAVTGVIYAKEIALVRTARMEGDLHHEILSMEAGAYLNGSCIRFDTPVQLNVPAGQNAISGPVWENANQK
ncbi:MAG: polymer-forming cytoskeletal protein [Alphaproteobacteria bacterium]|nr:polymer-forming cytoskeletal protein [Alphaproteobacteria bacterium]